MCLTIEPGVYVDGKHGVRIESVGVVVAADTDPKPKDGTQQQAACSGSGVGHQKMFLRFDIVTRVPISPALVDATQLQPDELAWLNEYNATCATVLAPYLANDTRALQWLLHETFPLSSDGRACLC
jgi:Xaa-Pro aminopeptidase